MIEPILSDAKAEADEVRTLLILGASGDLTARLLLPGLGGLLASGAASDLSLIGGASDDWDEARWRERVAQSFAEAQANGEEVDRVAATAGYLQVDVTDRGDLARTIEACAPPLAIYFALPPAVTTKACEALAGIELPADTRLVFEKPFGTDAASAAALNDLATGLVAEDHIHRVDHFLGMSTVLNIVGLRFANRTIEPVLSNEHVAEVEIVFDETLGLEGRAGYYDGAGAMVDMIQSHLLQVMSVFAMEAPPTLGAHDLRSARAQVLRATEVWNGDPVASSRRARYAAGAVDGRDLPAYADGAGIDPSRKTETLAEVVVSVDNWRWAGVPIRLRSGKAIGGPRQELIVTFKDPPRIPEGLTGYKRPERLRIDISPGAGRLRVDVNINGPGDPTVLDLATLEADFGAGELPEYGEVLRGVLAGDPTLSVRGDMAVDGWRIVEPVLAAWRRDEVPLEEYAAGTGGPTSWRDTAP